MLALAAGGVAVVAGAGGGGSLARCDGGAEAVLLPTAADLPDVVGADVRAARAALAQAGVPAPTVQEDWRVDDRERGRVLSQAGGVCGQPLALTVSTGGPLVDVAGLPPGVRRALGADPGPVRQVPTGLGRVWRSATVLSGACGDVAAARALPGLLDPAEVAVLETRCLTDPDVAVLEAVRDGLRGAGLEAAEAYDCGPGPRCTVRTADGAWVFEASVRTTDEAGLRCGPAAPLEVCVVRERPDGGQARTLQILGESPLGSPWVARQVVVLVGPWYAEVALRPATDAPDRRDPPLDGPQLVDVAAAALQAVADVSPAP